MIRIGKFLLGVLAVAGAGALGATPALAGGIHIRSASVSTSWEADAASSDMQERLRAACEGATTCEFNTGYSGTSQQHRVTIGYDCADGRLRYESLHWAEQDGLLRLSCYQQPRQPVDNVNNQPSPILPGFYRDNANGRNIGAMATPSTSASPLGFISSAASKAKGMVPIPNPYAELGAAIVNLLSKPSTKYYLPRLAAADGRIVLQMDDGSWCHIRNPTAHSVINTEWFFTPTSRDDVPKGTLPFCPMPDGFYKVAGNNGSNIYYLGNTAPGGRAPMTFYQIKFSSGYCLFTGPQNQKNLTTALIGAQSSDTAYAATVFSLGNDGNIAEGRKFLGNCRDDAVDPNAGGWSGAFTPPGWYSSPSNDVDHMRRILFLGAERTADQLSAMSADDVRNTTIVVLVNNSRQGVSYYQGLDNHSLAAVAGLRAYDAGGGRSTSAMSTDDIRNTAISLLVSRSRGTVSEFQAMDNFTLYQAALR